MLEAIHYTAGGSKRPAAFALPEELFDGTVNEPVLHQAIKAYLNNQRQGTAKTKTRSFISGGNQKPWKQKGTGRARQGSTRAPHWRGGGTVFGPIPRDYTTEVPRKVKALARRSALNARAREGRLHVVEKIALEAPSTKTLAGLLAKLGFDGQKVLVLTHGVNRNAYLSSRNLQQVHVVPYSDVAPYDVLWSAQVIVEEGAFTGREAEVTEALTAEVAKSPRTPKAAKAPRAAKAVKAPRATKAVKAAKKPAATKAVKKTSAKKAAAKPAAKKAAPKKKKGE
jgi:large subunit ribosomal protein L4